MTQISMIAAIDEAGGIGFNNQLLCHIPADLQYFKTTTMNKPIVMGRKTFESIGRPLPGRLNVVLTSTPFSVPNVLVFDSFDRALTELKDYPEVMIIGGERLFVAGMHHAARLYITRIHHHFTADVFFPKITHEWKCVSKVFRAHDKENKYDVTFYIYEREK